MRAVVDLYRPFTLIVPAAAMLCLGLAGLAPGSVGAAAWGRILFGMVAAAFLNAASNGLNQITDLDIDRVNKPARPLPSGRLTIPRAAALSAAPAVVALLIAGLLGRATFAIFLAAAILTTAYSAPPVRTKRFPVLSNLTIAAARGFLLPVAGWSVGASVRSAEPWFLGGVLGFYIIGAATTKDFSDVEGDRRFGIRTLPILLGPRRAAWSIAPFLVLPFPFLYVGARAGILHVHPMAMACLGAALALWGAYVAWLLVRRPNELAARGENHPAWRHMYLLTLSAQIGIAVAYRL